MGFYYVILLAAEKKQEISYFFLDLGILAINNRNKMNKISIHFLMRLTFKHLP